MPANVAYDYSVLDPKRHAMHIIHILHHMPNPPCPVVLRHHHDAHTRCLRNQRLHHGLLDSAPPASLFSAVLLIVAISCKRAVRLTVPTVPSVAPSFQGGSTCGLPLAPTTLLFGPRRVAQRRRSLLALISSDARSAQGAGWPTAECVSRGSRRSCGPGGR